MRILRIISALAILGVLVGCGTVTRGIKNAAKAANTLTTVTQDDSGNVTVSSKSDAKVEWSRSVDKDGAVITTIKVDNQGRPGIAERMLETALNRTEIIIGSGERTNDKDDD